jgi:hypothetical protein
VDPDLKSGRILLFFLSAILTIIPQLNQDQESQIGADACGPGSKTLAESHPVGKNSNSKSISLVRPTKVLDLTGSGFPTHASSAREQFQKSTLIMSTLLVGAGWTM